MNTPNIPDPAKNHPDDDQPEQDPPLEITHFASAIEALLRSPLSLLQALPEKRQLILPLLLLALFSAGVLGLVFGTYSGGTQLWAAPLKVGGGISLGCSHLFSQPLCVLLPRQFSPEIKWYRRSLPLLSGPPRTPPHRLCSYPLDFHPVLQLTSLCRLPRPCRLAFILPTR